MLGNTLKRLRGIYGYSGKEMSELLGISSSYLSEIENGKKKVSMDLLERYSELLNLRVSTLIRFSEDYEDSELNNASQKFITSLMSKVIEAYSNGK